MGRHREFDLEEALAAAQKVFWLKGYDGASISDLTEAMGINSPSLYAAFGSKQGLFKAVLNHYDASREKVMAKILAEATAKDVAARYLSALADYATDKKHPPGCLMIKAGLSPGEGEIAKQLARHKSAMELALRERFECAKRQGDLPKSANPGALVRYLLAIGSGLCVQAASGATREELRAMAELALVGFPRSEKKKAAVRKLAPAAV
ncbi:TetR/AcrR family transcriptional regulator [Rhizomicrobium electricum]|uniref:TetR/AcrR family transcriptional regulator n=1 Tax=Rhizomicrobium electricum TaxID=480070 RepID=A0ABN1EVH9_9PROT|nr:TetR/AcrR family transcriptional regulator [Rhizomicrobium electricum]NIJ49628.1 AcrR family transcriptional regulator [Rhizomicrobium electricum]